MRALLVIGALCVLGVWPGEATARVEKKPAAKKGKGKKPKRRGPYGASSRVERPAEARGEASLRVRSIDLSRRVVVVEVGGFPRAPAGNLFTFTDDRGRKFIAVSARCEEPFPSGTRVCDLETPVGYERHPWVGIELHLHGLQSTTVAAPKDEVARGYEAARALDEGGRDESAPSADAPADEAPERSRKPEKGPAAEKAGPSTEEREGGE